MPSTAARRPESSCRRHFARRRPACRAVPQPHPPQPQPQPPQPHSCPGGAPAPPHAASSPRRPAPSAGVPFIARSPAHLADSGLQDKRRFLHLTFIRYRVCFSLHARGPRFVRPSAAPASGAGRRRGRPGRRVLEAAEWLVEQDPMLLATKCGRLARRQCQSVVDTPKARKKRRWTVDSRTPENPTRRRCAGGTPTTRQRRRASPLRAGGVPTTRCRPTSCAPWPSRAATVTARASTSRCSPRAAEAGCRGSPSGAAAARWASAASPSSRSTRPATRPSPTAGSPAPAATPWPRGGPPTSPPSPTRPSGCGARCGRGGATRATAATGCRG